MTVTIRDVARQANVSISTVSRTFTAPDLVKPQTRTRVLVAADELGYEPVSTPPTASTDQTGRIGIVVPDLTNPFFVGILNGVQGTARQHEISVLFANSDEDSTVEINLIRDMARQVDGIILCSPSIADQRLQALTEDTPLVLVNRTFPGVPSVVMDSESGMRQAVAHLAALGHRRIAFLAGPRTSWSSAERRRGLVAATEERDMAVVEFGPFPPRFESGLQGADLALAAEVTAIIAYNDMVAFGALARLNARGARVPEDVSLIGFDDLIFSSISAPPLTTVSMPTEAAGRAAVNLLATLLPTDGENGPIGADETETRTLDTYLIVRATTAPPPRS
ncbi:MAG TPA: LacI family DNA-binding transcriptional regulator [Pseudonocardiaceae bacterium]|nr:LacI family DNA-binding transcriptional regulator [Pseudonocardiaceae bacterium]